eukprot:12423720-Heterocapsa_arctica.AAC.1
MEQAGADCYDTWEEAWKVFRSGAIMDGLALPAILDRYMAEFRERCYRYPTAWHICYRADVLCRTEWWTQEKRRQQSFHATNPQVSAYDVTMPWNSVIKAAATNQ